MSPAVQQVGRADRAAGSQQVRRSRIRRCAVVHERLGHRITLASAAIEDLSRGDEVRGLQCCRGCPESQVLPVQETMRGARRFRQLTRLDRRSHRQRRLQVVGGDSLSAGRGSQQQENE